MNGSEGCTVDEGDSYGEKDERFIEGLHPIKIYNQDATFF